MFDNNYLEDRRIRMNNGFWNDVVNSLKTFGTIAKPTNWYECLSVPLRCNNNIRVGDSTVFYKTWKEKGIWFINDLLDENGDLLSYENFCAKYLIQTNF